MTAAYNHQVHNYAATPTRSLQIAELYEPSISEDLISPPWNLSASLPSAFRYNVAPGLGKDSIEFFENLLEIEKNESGVSLFGHSWMESSAALPQRPLQVAFLTSIRDVGKEERVGQPISGSVIKGTIQHALESIHDARLGAYMDVVAIITDDVPKDLGDSGYVCHPDENGRWIFPHHLRNQRGEKASDFTFNVPSSFRALPREDLEGRAEAKKQFEKRVFEIMRATGADILVSDHYLARIEYLIDPQSFGLYGRVLNTHPGMVRKDYEFTCKGKLPYEMAIHHARGHRVDPESKVRASVTPHFKTGATFHVVSEKLDSGPIICDGELTEVFPTDTIADVCSRIYPTSKNVIFENGIRHYATQFFPFLRPRPDAGLEQVA